MEAAVKVAMVRLHLASFADHSSFIEEMGGLWGLLQPLADGSVWLFRESVCGRLIESFSFCKA